MSDELDFLETYLNLIYEPSHLPSKDQSRSWIYALAPGRTDFKSNASTGKWCIFRETAQIDTAWAKVSDAVARRDFECAKVSTRWGKGSCDQHVICVYTTDFNNETEVLMARSRLYALGFTEELGYKRCLDTQGNLYGDKREWYLRR